MTNDKMGSCPFCKQEYVVTDEILGAMVTCPNPECEKTFTATVAEEPSASPSGTSGSKLRRMKEDDFQAVHPDTLMAHIARSPILKTFAISLVFHLALIVLLSIGNFAMCVKYKTFSVTGAVTKHAEALKAETASEKKAERAKTQAAQKSKRAAQAKSDAGQGPKRAGSQASGTEQATAEKSAIEKTLEETSSERPTESSISLDDMDDGL